MASVKIQNPQVFDVVAKRLDFASEAALNDLGAVVEGEIRDGIANKKDSRGFVGRVQSGDTRRAATAQPARRTDSGYRQVTAFKAPFEKVGAIANGGRRPGKGVSAAGQRKLNRWARRKLGPVKAADGKRFKSGGREKAERSRVYLIARAIKKRGIPGLHVFSGVATSLRGGRAQRIFLKAFRRYSKQDPSSSLGKGA